MLLNDFVNAGVACGVLSEAEVREHLPALNGSQDGARIASVLVSAGKLTQYQAEMLLRGSGPNLVLGNYVLLDRLGQGGMGDVFKARHRRMDRVVALKTISPHFLRVPDALDRFYREAKAAARLSHPNIVTAHDADEAGGVHFLVMEYCAGSDLDAVVAFHGALTSAQAIRVTLDAARGLEYAHSKGVVHRDIKPANLMYTLEGTVKILDMGLARIDQAEGERFTRSHCGFGSIDYMPPEQADSARLADQRSDVYSLGCTLYKLLTGRVIYESTSALKTLTSHREAPIPALAIVHPQRDQIEELYRRMVAKLPEDRPQTMAEVVEILTELSGDCDLAPLTAAVKVMHDRPSWLVDPEAKTIRPGEPVTPLPEPPAQVDPNKKTAGGPRGKTVPVPAPASTPPRQAAPSPSELAWKTVAGPLESPASAVTENPGPKGVTRPQLRRPAAGKTAATPGLVGQSPEASTTLADGEDWLDDVVSESRAADPRRKKPQKLDPMLLAAGAGVGGFVLLLLLMWIFSRGDPQDKPIAQNDGKPATGTVAPGNPVSNTNGTPPITVVGPVIVPVIVPPKPPFEPPILPPKKGEVEPTKTLPEQTPEKTLPEKTPPEKQPEKTPAPPEVTDLVKAIDVRQDGIGKAWEKQATGLVARPTVAPGMHPPGQSVFGLQLPVTVTPNYQLRMVVEHLAGYPGPLIVAFPQGNQWRLVVIDELPPPEPPGGFPKGPPPGFPDKKGPRPPKGGPGPGREPPPKLREVADVTIKSGKMTLVFKVRDNGQTIECNDERITAAVGNEPPLREMTDLATRKTVLLLSLGNYRISSLEWEVGTGN